MTPLEFLSQCPEYAGFTRKSKILLFAYYLRKYQGKPTFTLSAMKACFQKSLLRVPADLTRLLRELSRGRESPLLAARPRGHYSLSVHGVQEVEAILPPSPETLEGLDTFLRAAIPHLRKVIANVKGEDRRAYLAEAVACLGVGARRATIVLTWLATVDHLQKHVLAHHLAGFNSALRRRSDRVARLTVATQDDFEEIKDSVLIEVCRSARVITNDVRKILDEKLGTRNSCAHPSTIHVGDAKVVEYVEDLVTNVIAKHTT